MQVSTWLVTILGCICFHGAFANGLPGQEKAERPIPRDNFFAIESLDEPTRKLSEELLLKALDSEAFYTLVGQLKPVSEGFWGGYFSVDPPELAELEQVRAAVRAWNVPDLFHADVLVYESMQYGLRYASAYVVHIPSLKERIRTKSDFFGRWGIHVDTPPSEIMMAIERSRQPEDRWRGFGLVFGYPEYAIDFFVAAGMHQRSTGEFVERDFRQIATFSGRTGQFVYAVPKLSPPLEQELELQRRSAALLMEYKRLRPQYAAHPSNPVALLRDWMDDGHGHCHPDHLIDKLPASTEAQLDAEIARWAEAENRPPEVRFNHLYVVLSQEEFEAVQSSNFLLNQFAAADQGLPKFLPIDEQAGSICLLGQETYIELANPRTKPEKRVGRIGMVWSVEKVGELDAVERRLTNEAPRSISRLRYLCDLGPEREINWHSALVQESFSLNDTAWWFSETHRDFIPALFPEKGIDRDWVARRDFLETRYKPNRLLRNFTHMTLDIPVEIARQLRSDLEKVGYRTDEFDTRTWILKGADFRLMLLLRTDVTKPKIKTIGFETNPGTSPQSPITVGTISITFDGNRSGWIRFE
jgi:hypothetical protein